MYIHMHSFASHAFTYQKHKILSYRLSYISGSFIFIQNTFGHAKTLFMKNCVQHIRILPHQTRPTSMTQVPATIICAVEICECLGYFLQFAQILWNHLVLLNRKTSNIFLGWRDQHQVMLSCHGVDTSDTCFSSWSLWFIRGSHIARKYGKYIAQIFHRPKAHARWMKSKLPVQHAKPWM